MSTVDFFRHFFSIFRPFSTFREQPRENIESLRHLKFISTAQTFLLVRRMKINWNIAAVAAQGRFVLSILRAPSKIRSRRNTLPERCTSVKNEYHGCPVAIHALVLFGVYLKYKLVTCLFFSPYLRISLETKSCLTGVRFF